MNISTKIIRGLKIISGDIASIVRRQVNFYRVKPVTSTLFLTYRCNSHCSTCTFWKRPAQEDKKKEIGFDEWKRIIDKLADSGIRITEIFGGNVLLRKELLISVLKYLRRNNFFVHLPTNQIGLDDDIAEAIASCADMVYISTDGTGEYQDTIRGQKGAFQRVENTVTKLLKLRKNNKTPRLICNTTVSKYNVGILEQLVEYALAMEFDEIHFEYAGEMSQEHIDHSIIDGLRPSPYYIKQDESILVDQSGAKLLKENLKQIKKKYSHKNIVIRTINIDVLSEQYLHEGTIPHKKCYVERNEVTVDPSGNMVICPFINNYIMGNLLDNSFVAIWNNYKHRNFRKHQNRGDLEMCEHCILGVQRNPGLLTSLKRVYLTRVVPNIVKWGERN